MPRATKQNLTSIDTNQNICNENVNENGIVLVQDVSNANSTTATSTATTSTAPNEFVNQQQFKNGRQIDIDSNELIQNDDREHIHLDNPVSLSTMTQVTLTTATTRTSTSTGQQQQQRQQQQMINLANDPTIDFDFDFDYHLGGGGGGLMAQNSSSLPYVTVHQPILTQQNDPVIIRGNGNLTLFGLSNSFNDEFPSSLIGRVSREEFEQTIERVNKLLSNQHSMSAKLLLLGCLCCCCSLGCSILWPSVALNKRTKASLKKLLASENSRLYRKLGLNWRLARQRAFTNHAFLEYVLLIEFIPKVNLYLPE